VLTAGLAILSLLAGQPASAEGPLVSPTPIVTTPDCDVDPATGECRISAGEESSTTTEQTQASPGVKKPGGSRCVFKGQTVPCRTADGFFDAASGCYLTPQDAPTSLVNPVNGYPPGTKFYRCWVILGVVEGRPEGIERFESVIREPGQTETIDPRVAAQQVVETMNFVAPHLGLSPYVQSATHEGIVNVPIWMWVTDPGSTTTGPQTKRAAVGGVAIEATGTVDRIEWSMGAGGKITCKGAGTPFSRAMAVGKSLKEIPASPTCGYKYRKTSRCAKSGAYQVTATAYWNVHWTGGGMEGDIPLNFSRSVPLQVTDLRPVLVDPNGSSTRPQPSLPACTN
jgi:hypothetical protein